MWLSGTNIFGMAANDANSPPSANKKNTQSPKSPIYSDDATPRALREEDRAELAEIICKMMKEQGSELEAKITSMGYALARLEKGGSSARQSAEDAPKTSLSSAEDSSAATGLEAEVREMARRQEDMSSKLQKTMANTQNFCQAIEAMVLLEERCKDFDVRLNATESHGPTSPGGGEKSRSEVSQEQLNAALRSVKEAVDTAHQASNTVLVRLEKVQQRVESEGQQRAELEERLCQDFRELASRTLPRTHDIEARLQESVSEMQSMRDKLDAIAEVTSSNEFAKELQALHAKVSDERHERTSLETTLRLETEKLASTIRRDMDSAATVASESSPSQGEFKNMVSELTSRLEQQNTDMQQLAQSTDKLFEDLARRIEEQGTVRRRSISSEQVDATESMKERIASLEARWESLNKSKNTTRTSQDAAQDAAKLSINMITSRLNDLETLCVSIDKGRTAQETQHSKTKRNLDEVAGRLEGVEKRWDLMDARLTKLSDELLQSTSNSADSKTLHNVLLKDSDSRVADLEKRWHSLGNNHSDMKNSLSDALSRLGALESRWESLDTRIATSTRSFQDITAAHSSAVENVHLAAKAAQEAEARSLSTQETTEKRCDDLSSKLSETKRVVKEISAAQGIWSETVNLSLKAAQDAMDSVMESMKGQKTELQDSITEQLQAHQKELQRQVKQHMQQELLEIRDFSIRDDDTSHDGETAGGGKEKDLKVANLRLSLVESRCSALEDWLDQSAPKMERSGKDEDLRAVVINMQAELEAVRGNEDNILRRLENGTPQRERARTRTSSSVEHRSAPESSTSSISRAIANDSGHPSSPVHSPVVRMRIPAGHVPHRAASPPQGTRSSLGISQSSQASSSVPAPKQQTLRSTGPRVERVSDMGGRPDSPGHPSVSSRRPREISTIASLDVKVVTSAMQAEAVTPTMATSPKTTTVPAMRRANSFGRSSVAAPTTSTIPGRTTPHTRRLQVSPKT